MLSRSTVFNSSFKVFGFGSSSSLGLGSSFVGIFGASDGEGLALGFVIGLMGSFFGKPFFIFCIFLLS